MAERQPPYVLQNAGETHTAEGFRAMMSMLLGGIGAGVFIPRGGVHPAFGGRMQISQNSPTGMSVVVDTGMAVVPGTSTSFRGPYVCVNDAAVVLPIDAADSTQHRTDIIVAQIYDSQYGGADDEWALEVVKGTNSGAAPGPAPSTPANALKLGEVRVDANTSAITNALINNNAQYTVANGGMLPCRSSADVPASPYQGMVIFRIDLGEVWLYWSGSWRVLYKVLTANTDSQIVDGKLWTGSQTDTSATSDTDVNVGAANLQSTPLVAGKMYRAVWQILFTGSAANNRALFKCKKNTTQVGQNVLERATNTTSNFDTRRIEFVWRQDTTETVSNLNLTMQLNTGTGSVTARVQAEYFYAYVEEIGNPGIFAGA